MRKVVIKQPRKQVFREESESSTINIEDPEQMRVENLEMILQAVLSSKDSYDMAVLNGFLDMLLYMDDRGKAGECLFRVVSKWNISIVEEPDVLEVAQSLYPGKRYFDILLLLSRRVDNCEELFLNIDEYLSEEDYPPSHLLFIENLYDTLEIVPNTRIDVLHHLNDAAYFQGAVRLINLQLVNNIMSPQELLPFRPQIIDRMNNCNFSTRVDIAFLIGNILSFQPHSGAVWDAFTTDDVLDFLVDCADSGCESLREGMEDLFEDLANSGIYLMRE